MAATIVAAASRFLARSHSMWDWDEVLFCLGVRDYDVAQHHPHPPGYPLFIGAAKLIRPLVHSDFLSLQIVVLVSAAALLPLLFFFAREARFPFATALGGALIFVFLPNVWIYGGTAMSDEPSLALTLLACALLLRGCRSSGAYLAGAISLGLAAGIRPQALLVGVACGAVATLCQWRRSRRVVVIAAIGGAVVIAASYAGAALASQSVSAFIGIMRTQSRWVKYVDSFHNPHRPALGQLAPLFFFTPVAARAMEIVSILAALGAIAGIVLRRTGTLIALATFVPFAIFAWFMLDATAVSRYAIGYLPLHALLAADLITIAASAFRLPRAQSAIAVAASCILAASLAWWTWPAVKRIRSADAPPVLVMRWTLRHTYPGAGTLFVHAGLGPFADYFLSGYEKRFFERPDELPYSGYTDPAFVLLPFAVTADDATNFTRPHDRLWRIVRQRYFEASVIAPWDLLRFGDGWHDPEGDGVVNWRWMKRSSVTMLPPVNARGRLRLRVYAPLDILHSPPTVTVELNGAVVDRFVVSQPETERTLTVPSRQGGPNELRITTSESIIPARIHPGGDGRELGLKVLELSWQPAAL